MKSLIKRELMSAEQHLRSAIRLSSNESPFFVKNLVDALIALDNAKFSFKVDDLKDPEFLLEADELLV